MGGFYIIKLTKIPDAINNRCLCHNSKLIKGLSVLNIVQKEIEKTWRRGDSTPLFSIYPFALHNIYLSLPAPN